MDFLHRRVRIVLLDGAVGQDKHRVQFAYPENIQLEDSRVRIAKPESIQPNLPRVVVKSVPTENLHLDQVKYFVNV